MDKKIPLIAVCGPTASGKTSLAVSLAETFDGEVVSADSMQIYKGMDIGTAKPAIEEMRGIKHHMLDIAEIDSSFNVSDYCEQAHKIIKAINDAGKLAFIAGGTGLYVDSLINDIDFMQGQCDDSVRIKLSEIADTQGSAVLHDMLCRLDPDAASQIHSNNTKRVIRALEHIEITGEKFSEYKKRAAERESRYNPLMLFIDHDRQVLYNRIDKRVDLMIENGLLDEARRIYDNNYNRELTAMCAIGYKELFEYFDGICDLQTAIDNIKQNSRHYAKRQLTWFRRNKNLYHIDGSNNPEHQAEEIIRKWLGEE